MHRAARRRSRWRRWPRTRLPLSARWASRGRSARLLAWRFRGAGHRAERAGPCSQDHPDRHRPGRGRRHRKGRGRVLAAHPQGYADVPGSEILPLLHLDREWPPRCERLPGTAEGAQGGSRQADHDSRVPAGNSRRSRPGASRRNRILAQSGSLFWSRMAIRTRWCPAATRSTWRAACRMPNSSSTRMPDTVASSSITRPSCRRRWRFSRH